MFKLHKINPMVRAIGTMGAVAALAGGISFAALTSNTVALSPNTLVSDTASLAIAPGTCPGGDNNTTTTPGFTNVKLAPGVDSAPLTFCLTNNGDVSLDVTTAIPQGVFAGDTGVQPGDVNLKITCDTGTSNGALNAYTGGTPLGMLAAGDTDNCSAVATLNPSYGGQGGQSVPSFDIDFVGTQTPSV